MIHRIVIALRCNRDLADALAASEQLTPPRQRVLTPSSLRLPFLPRAAELMQVFECAALLCFPRVQMF